MATVRPGGTQVLMVVDVQVGVMSDAWNAPAVIGRISHAVARARSAGAPIIWVQHGDDDLPKASPAWQWVPELGPMNGEHLIHKRFNSSFEQTELDQLLAQLGASHIVLAGAATNRCIRATAYGALERGYDLTLVSDAHTTTAIPLENGATIDAASIIQELNIAMNWLTYPGRKNATASAEQVNFCGSSGVRPVS